MRWGSGSGLGFSGSPVGVGKVAEVSGRAYTVRLLGAMAVYAIALIVSIVLLDGSPDQPWRTFVALVPVLPMTYIVWVVVARFRSLDEYWQQVHLTALPFAFLGSILVVFTWGFLENAGFERLDGFVVFGIMNGLYLIGLWWARRRLS